MSFILAPASGPRSEGYEGMPTGVSRILHELTPLVAGQFIRDQGRTQVTVRCGSIPPR